MLIITRHSRPRFNGRPFIITALSLAGLGLAASGPQAARAHRPTNAESTAMRQVNLLSCGNGTYEGKRFPVGVKGSKIREVIMCTRESSTEVSVTAQALAVGLMRASEGPQITREAQISALAKLRSMRIRNVDDTSISAEERTGRLATIDMTIIALESDLLKL